MFMGVGNQVLSNGARAEFTRKPQTLPWVPPTAPRAAHRLPAPQAPVQFALRHWNTGRSGERRLDSGLAPDLPRLYVGYLGRY